MPQTNSPWKISKVGDQFDIQLGKMLDAARNSGTSKLYLGNRAVQWGHIDVTAAGIVRLSQRDCARFRLRANDLLVCEGGEVGRSAIWRDQLPECYYQKALHRLRPRSGYSPVVMQALLEYWASINAFADFVTQTSIAHLPQDKFLMMPLPLIPQREQRRIAEVLEDIGDLTRTLERLIAKKQAIKQGMMQQLLTGKSRLPGFTEPWRRAKVGDVATVSRGASPRPIASTRWFSDSSPVGWVRIADLSRSDGLRLTSTTQKLSPDGIARSRFLPAGTLIMSIAATVGLPIVTGIDACIHDGFVAIERLKRVDQTYLLYVLKSLESELRSSGQTGSQANVNTTIVKELSIWLTSEDEQIQIGRVLRDADTELSKLRLRLQKARDTEQGMMQELLTGRTRFCAPEGFDE